MNALKRKQKPGKRLNGKGFSWDRTKAQLSYYAMALLPLLSLLIFNYLPMCGIYLAFVDYKPAKGIFGSDFVGFDNFIDFFESADFTRVFRNTLLYGIGNLVLVNLLCGMLFALLLFEIKSKVSNKVFQTCMLLPAFLSWTVVSAALLVFLNPDAGLLNDVLEALGMDRINWYLRAEYWPYIILLCMMYHGGGMASVYFYSALLNSNMELYEAARLDGANRLQQIWHISIPAMSKVFCITLITGLGGVLGAGVSPYFELTLDNGALYDTTQVIGTYIYNGLGGGRYSFLTAVGLVQSVVGLILVLISNLAVKKIDPESAMF